MKNQEIIMNFIYPLIYVLLIFSCLAGMGGLFFFRDYFRRISCMSVSYISFTAFIIFLALERQLTTNVVTITIVVMTIFSINILAGIKIASSLLKAGLKN
jgi:hypothetical protein